MSDQIDNIRPDLVEACLRIFHGEGDYGWRLLKQTWPEVAITEQRRKMKLVVTIAQSEMRQALEAVQSEILLDGQLGEIVETTIPRPAKTTDTVW